MLAMVADGASVHWTYKVTKFYYSWDKKRTFYHRGRSLQFAFEDDVRDNTKDIQPLQQSGSVETKYEILLQNSVIDVGER